MTENLLKLEHELKSETWLPSPHDCFIITDPKLREVWASQFRDRVVHHLVVNQLEPFYERKFIHGSYACRKGKGAHNAVSDLQKIIHQNNDYFYLQADIQSFFVSIDQTILFTIISHHIKDSEITRLVQKIIFQNPSKNCIIKSNRKLLKSIPAHKSLFSAPEGSGLPIGNLTSQFFANVYLNELDQFVKHTLKVKHYYRYMDDIVLLSPHKWELKIWRDEIAFFLTEKLRLRLHPKKQIIQPAKNGINFLGYINKPDYLLARRRSVSKLKDKLWHFNRRLEKIAQIKPNDTENPIFKDPYHVFSLEPKLTEEIKHLFSSINSSFGILKHADCFHLRKNLYEKHFEYLRLYLKPANRDFAYFSWKER